MWRPASSPLRCEENGIDKRAVVEQLLSAGKRVAYWGDGYTDQPAARLVEEQRRFVRADLTRALEEGELEYRPFSSW